MACRLRGSGVQSSSGFDLVLHAAAFSSCVGNTVGDKIFGHEKRAPHACVSP